VKRGCLAALFLLAGICIARAGFELPSYVYPSSQLKEAKKKARSEGKPLTFLLTDQNTRCGLATSASLDIIRELSDHSVIVYVDSKGWQGIPGVVRSAFRSSEAGRYIPKTVVTNAAGTKVIAIVPYVRSRGDRVDLLSEARRKIRRQANQESAVKVELPAVLLQVLEFSWEGDLKPMPLIKLTDHFLSMGYKMRLLKSGKNKCRFEVILEGLAREIFYSRLNTFLEGIYRIESSQSGKSKKTYHLKAR
jgi:hypothetical protein